MNLPGLVRLSGLKGLVELLPIKVQGLLELLGFFGQIPPAWHKLIRSIEDPAEMISLELLRLSKFQVTWFICTG